MDRVAEMAGLEPNVLWALAGMLLALLLGSLVRTVMQRGASAEQRQNAHNSLRTWWLLFIVFTLVVLAGPLFGVLLFALASLLGLREFLGHTATRAGHHTARTAAYLAVPLAYLLVWFEALSAFWVVMPLYVALWLPARTVMSGRTSGFLHDVGVICWGVLLLVFCLSHAVWLLMLPASSNPVGGPAGWFLYLVALTQINDIAQALWGRRFGKHRVTPSVSPNKTWEGLLLGGATTVLTAVLAAPLLTPLAAPPAGMAGPLAQPWLAAAVAGLIIFLGGFFGDITMSAVKRDVGIKDSGTLLPGQGGILDRIDSLTFTAPLFFYYVYFLYDL